MFQPRTFDRHAVATLATWFMTLLIQRAEHRDTQAIHAKLDALIEAQPNASNSVARIDQREPEEISRPWVETAPRSDGVYGELEKTAP